VFHCLTRFPGWIKGLLGVRPHPGRLRLLRGPARPNGIVPKAATVAPWVFPFRARSDTSEPLPRPGYRTAAQPSTTSLLSGPLGRRLSGDEVNDRRGPAGSGGKASVAFEPEIVRDREKEGRSKTEPDHLARNA